MGKIGEAYRILGIDPGTNYTGYGVLEVEGREVRAVIMGEIDLHKITDPYAKLRYIFDRVRQLVTEYEPREVALESPFFGRNVQSMLKLGRAQGVAMAAALSLEVDVFKSLTCKNFGNCTKSCFHNTAGCTEDNACTCCIAEGLIKVLVVKSCKVDTRRLNHLCKFLCC